MIRLEIKPKLWSRIERLGKKPGRLGGHTSLPPHDLVDSLDGNTKMFGKTDLRQPHRLQKLLLQNLTWMGWDTVLW